ncbi:MAG TPA: hypothetical protein VLT33_02930, partial [Labilithrix sp.]|nr:hypothetical protein [Labilithrix sp.]
MSAARRPRRFAAALSAIVGSALLVAAPARAHLMPAQQGTLNVLGDAVFEVVAVPVSALHGADDDGDGRLSAVEVAAHEGALQREIGARFRLYDAAPSDATKGAGEHGRAGALELVVVRAEHDERVEPAELSTADTGPGARHVLVLMKTRFAAEPRALRLVTDLFGPGDDARQLTIRATRGKETEVAILRAGDGAHAFFPPPAPASRAPIDAPSRRAGAGASLLLAAIAAGTAWAHHASRKRPPP